MRCVGSLMGIALVTALSGMLCAAEADLPTVVAIAGGGTVETWALTITAKGQPVGSRRSEALAALFRFYDINDDQRLDQSEAVEIASPAGLRQLPLGRLLPTMVKRPSSIDRNEDGVLMQEEFQAYYMASSQAGLWVTCDVTPRTAEMNHALLRAMQIEPGDSIDQEHIQMAMARLATLDTNADELISPGEILSGHIYPGITPMRMVSGRDAAVDSIRNLSVTRRSATADDHRWSIDLDQADVVLNSHSKSTSVRLHLAEADASRAEVALNDLVSQFVSGAGDDDELKLSEVAGMQNQVDLQQLIPLADRNRDDILSAQEFDQWQAVVRAYVRSVVVVTILDFEQNLFTGLDGNFDGSLSSQELADAWQTWSQDGVVRGGKFLPAELPRQLRILVSHGPCQQLLDQGSSEGPPWFQAMDRNRDGRISRDEFPASSDIFTNMDRDGDGYLSLKDVAAAMEDDR